MRIAVLADIHANFPALQAAIAHVDAWKPDAVVVAGDVINRGPRPLECLEIIEEKRAKHGWKVIRGNHEDYVLAEMTERPGRPDWERKLCQHSVWTCEKVRDRLPACAAWPERLDFANGVCVMHASMKGNRAGLYPFMSDALLIPMIDTSSAVFCVGHTHVPFVRHAGNTLVVNAGAVGMPFDGDPRACVAHIENIKGIWHAEHVRLDYDRDQTNRDYTSTGYLKDGGPMVHLIHEEFRTARPRLGEWHKMFEKLVRENQITVEASVEEMLTSP